MTEIEDELETIGKGVANVSAAHITSTEYRVLSARNGSVTAYTVDIDDLTCPCEDMRHTNGEHVVCAHLAKAILCHTEHKSAKDWAAQDLSMVAERANSLIHDLRDAEDYLATEIETAAVAAAQEQTAEGEPPDTPDEHDSDTSSAQDKAADLQEAFDSVIDDMVVEVSDGMIFFKTGYSTPDEWPYPGFQSTFDAITSPDPCLFVHDGSPDWADSPHELYDSKPDEYMKNAVDPDDVDDYLESLAI